MSVARGLALLTGLLLPSIASAQSSTSSQPTAALCEVLKNPKQFDGKKITIHGKINLEFENFSIYDARCNTWPGIWLMFGGDVPTPTMSTWNDTTRPSGKDIRVDGVPYSLIKDDRLDEFTKGIAASDHRKPLYRVTSTLAGTFLAGKPTKDLPNFPGYGHMGCCYLFIIQQVLSVEKKPMLDAREKWSTMVDPKRKK